MPSDYWGKRLADKIYDKNSEEMLKQLAVIYKNQSRDIQDKINDIYIKMLEDGDISTTNLYAYGRFTQLMREINLILKEYGAKEIETMNDGLEDAYRASFGRTSEELGNPINWGLQNTYIMQEVVNANFKGKNFSQRIWNNRDNLSKVLEKNLQDIVASGMSKDKAVKRIMDIEKSSFSNADRLVRTETMRVTNDGQKQSFINAGRTHGYYVYSDDDRNCEECARISKESRENPLPLETMEAVHHPNCRCTIRPVVKMKTMHEYIQENYAQGMQHSLDKNISKGMTMQLNKQPSSGNINILPDADNASIPTAKIFKYALVEPNKAKAFKEALGYDLSNGNELIQNIKDNIKNFEAVEKGSTEYGTLYEIRMNIDGANGKTADVKTGWIKDKETGETRLTSAYVVKKKKGD